MFSPTVPNLSTWTIAFIATLGVIIRPFKVPEAIWAVLGAVVLVIAGLLPWHDALQAIAKGTDVYLFLTGMMLLAEMARREGLFDYVPLAPPTRRTGPREGCLRSSMRSASSSPSCSRTTRRPSC